LLSSKQIDLPSAIIGVDGGVYCQGKIRENMRFLNIMALAGTLALAGCATPYGSTGLAGGYREHYVNDKLIKVDFFGNGYIDSAHVQSFALYRCAEVAKARQKAYFFLYDSIGAAARDVPSAQPRVGTLGGKPMAFAFVRMVDQPLTGALDVKEVLAQLESTVHPGGQPGAKP